MCPTRVLKKREDGVSFKSHRQPSSGGFQEGEELRQTGFRELKF